MLGRGGRYSGITLSEEPESVVLTSRSPPTAVKSIKV